MLSISLKFSFFFADTYMNNNFDLPLRVLGCAIESSAMGFVALLLELLPSLPHFVLEVDPQFLKYQLIHYRLPICSELILYTESK